MLKCREKLVRKVVKNNGLNGYCKRDSYGRSPTDGYQFVDGKYVFCDGFRVYMLNENAGIAKASLPNDRIESIIRGSHTEKFNAAKLPLYEYDEGFTHGNVNVDDLAAFIKDKSNSYSTLYPQGKYIVSFAGNVSVKINARYLLEAIQLIMHEPLKVTRTIEVYNDGNRLHPVWVFNEDGEAAMVMPCR